MSTPEPDPPDDDDETDEPDPPTPTTTEGQFAIFRVTETGDTEATVTDKIEVEGDADTPDGRTKLISFRPRLSRARNSNASPYTEEPKKPDTGLSDLMYEITLLIDESAGTAGAIKKLRNWFREAGTVRGKFKEGRFGIRNNYRPEFNLTPSLNAGYKFTDFDCLHDLGIRALFRVTLIMEFSGEITSLGGST